ncbi:hypothetical protein V8F20_009642 [Naviculisporaceae sp. PSN 640]
MASLNLSINGPSIKSSYNGVINGPPISSSSPTYAQWALFSVQAPLLSAFQNSGAKESILKVESTGDGELADLVEDLNEGRIQFAFVKVKDPNSGLPKNILIAWCGGGVPERTKGYFTSHVSAVSKILHGYHVQITARSEADLAPEDIIQKVADASGAKYAGGGSVPLPTPGPPPLAKKPVFTPTASSSGSTFNPLVAARNKRQENVDDDGWGKDAPQITRSELEKVESAYKPTKVDINDLRKNKDDSRFGGAAARADDRPSDIVKGTYQPVGKVDIAALRAQAKSSGDDRPTTVKGAYEPVGKVDIAAIRAKAQQRPAEPEVESVAPKSLAERTAAFTASERLTELPKPKVAKKFGTSTFTGTKAPTPVGLGFGGPSVPAAPPVGAASRTFADQGGKTPAQIWAEKKAKQGGAAPTSTVPPPVASPITSQPSGQEWKSGYSGKSWAPVQTAKIGRGGVDSQKTGETDRSEPEQPASPSGGVSALRDRFKNTAPISASRGAPSVPSSQDDHPAPPPPPADSRPSGGFALPGLPSRPTAANQEEQEEEEEEETRDAVESRELEERSPSPPRIAIPVARSAATELQPAEESLPPRPIPVPQELPREEELPDEEEAYDPRAAAANVATTGAAGAAETQQAAAGGDKRALIQFDYEKAEDNEINLREGEYVTDIDMVDDDWWFGTNSQGARGLFPSSYVELVEDGPSTASVPEPAPQAPEPSISTPVAATPAAPAKTEGHTATAQYDYEAAEDNELSFPEGAKITNLEFPDEDWWFGHYKGASGLFPANYVELDS